MKIRDVIANLAIEMQQRADRCKEGAKCHALDALNGDREAREEAIRSLARADAIAEVVKRLDDLRLRIEMGEIV